MSTLPAPAILLLSLALGACSRDDAGGPAQSSTPPAAAVVDEQAGADALLALREARRTMKSTEPRRAADHLRRAVQLDPTLYDAQLLLGKTLVHLSDVVVGTPTRDQALLTEAIEALAAAERAQPGSAETDLWMAQALAFGGRKEESIEFFERATTRDPEHGLAHKRAGIVLGELGREDEARAHLERALELLPQDATAWFQFGLRLELAGDLEQARDAYLRSIEIDWSVPGVYARLAAALRATGDAQRAKEAVSAFRTWTEFGAELKERLRRANANRSNPDAIASVVETLVRGRLYRHAGPWLQRAQLIAPDHVRAAELRALVEAGVPFETGTGFPVPDATLFGNREDR